MKNKRLCSILFGCYVLLCFASMTIFAEEIVKGSTIREISAADKFAGAISELNNGTQSNITLILKDDIDASKLEVSQTNLSAGTLTIYGGGHKLTFKQFSLTGTASVYLGGKDYTETLTITSNDPTRSNIHLNGDASLYIYDKVTICDSEGSGQAGGVQAVKNSKVYMYGGTIKNCFNPYSVAGGVMLDGDACFYLHNGFITDCNGVSGGGFCISGNALLEMSGGTISGCKDNWFGGGGVAIYMGEKASFVMTGGTIENNSGKYGGGVLALLANGKCEITGGTLKNNVADCGGGLFVYSESAVVGEKAEIYNNTATTAGDDLYVNENAKLSISSPPQGLILRPCGDDIDGWYDDSNETRWNVHSKENTYALPVAPGVIEGECGIKAAHSKTFTLKFETNNGAKSTIEDVIGKEGTVIKLDKYIPTRDRFDFEGWYVDAELKTKISEVTLVDDITVYAKWEESKKLSSGSTTKPDSRGELKVPKTGDNSNILLWVSLFSVSVLVLIAVIVHNRRKNIFSN